MLMSRQRVTIKGNDEEVIVIQFRMGSATSIGEQDTNQQM